MENADVFLRGLIRLQKDPRVKHYHYDIAKNVLINFLTLKKKTVEITFGL